MATHNDVNSTDRKAVIAREKERFGGVKIGSAFFGWLSATGLAVILTALVAAAGAGVGVGLVSSASELTDAARSNGVSTEEIGWFGVILVLVVVLISYYAGGYVAGRMARFDGAKQGIAVFGWSVVTSVVLAVLGAVAGAKYDVLDNLNVFPRIPGSLSDLTLQAGVVLVGVVVAAAVGAVLGGIAGMAYHRRIDIEGLGR
ncbi:hypothetical protein [Nocardioides sp.]|uniref:hypothetical protein n=1 Tax=Nocardioides sp. TaxID=35761 RepID=UPI0035138847